jgi:hypothetical protein
MSINIVNGNFSREGNPRLKDLLVVGWELGLEDSESVQIFHGTDKNQTGFDLFSFIFNELASENIDFLKGPYLPGESLVFTGDRISYSVDGFDFLQISGMLFTNDPYVSGGGIYSVKNGLGEEFPTYIESLTVPGISYEYSYYEETFTSEDPEPITTTTLYHAVYMNITPFPGSIDPFLAIGPTVILISLDSEALLWDDVFIEVLSLSGSAGPI